MHIVDILDFRDFALARRARSFLVSWRRVHLATGLVTGRTVAAGSTFGPPMLDAALALTATAGPSSGRMDVSLPCPGAIESLPALAAAALARGSVSAGRLEFSISTHRAAGVDMEALLALSALRDQGIGLALSGLRADRLDLLERLPLTAVILDPALVSCVPGSAAALAEVHAMVDAALARDLAVVAPGLETDSQLALLHGLGAGFGEGERFGADP